MALVLWWFWVVALAGGAGVWGWLNLSRTHRATLGYVLAETEVRSDAGLPSVAIIVPGRDEAEHLPETLRGLCAQDYPDYRVVFVDDASGDGTPGITREMAGCYEHLRVVRNEASPPAGWVGKPHAVWRGYEALVAEERRTGWRAEWVCFTDADIHWHPQCLRSAVRHGLETGADLVGLYPELWFGSWVEALVQVQLVLALGVLYPVERAMDPGHEDTLTGGAFMLVRRSHYDAIGGHRAVQGLVVEDLALGKALKANGARVRVAMASELFWCRMYEGWADQWEGLTKNAYAGIDYNPLKALGMLTGVAMFNVLPTVSLLVWGVAVVVGSVDLSSVYGWLPGVLAGVGAVMGARAMDAARKFCGLNGLYAWSLAAGSAVYGVIVLASIRDYYLGGNRWKGRRYG
ncbi:MAG: glycosyltransferase family A protein [Phycisphaeraceae bacterium]